MSLAFPDHAWLGSHFLRVSGDETTDDPLVKRVNRRRF